MITTLDDIEQLLGVAEENVHLDFKRGAALNDLTNNNTKLEIVRDVTAFANAGGGTLVYGVAEQLTAARSVASALDPVTNVQITRDRLANIISSNSEPPLTAFQVLIIPVPSGGCIVVIEVTAASTAHQNRADLRYYRRVDASNKPMLDFEIRDVMGLK